MWMGACVCLWKTELLCACVCEDDDDAYVN